MDHYTVLRCHVAALERWAKDHPNDRSSVDISEFSISPLLAEAFKRVDPHRYVLLASDGCVHLLASTNAPVPAEFKHKRYMKSNPRSNIRDVVQVLYNLLGVSVVQGSSDLAGFIRLLNFFISFQIENEEMVNLNVCSEWFHSIRRQFLQGPSFETPEVWKAKYRNPAIKGLYDSVAKQEQIDTLSSFVDKQATILFSMNSESLDAQLEALRASASSVRALVEEKSGEIEALKKLLARYDEELEEFSTILGDLHGKVENLQKPAAKEAVSEVLAKEAVQEAASEAVKEEAAEAAVEVAQEVVAEAAAEVVAEAAAEVAQEVVAEAAAEVAQEVVAEAAAEVAQEVVAEAAVEVVAEAAAEAAVEAVQEVVAEAAAEVAQEVVAEAAAEVAQEVVAEAAAEAVQEVVAEAAAEAVQEVVAEAAAEAVQEVVAEAAAEAVQEVVAEAAVEVAQEVVAEAAVEAVKEVVAEAAAEAVKEVVAEAAVEAAVEAIKEVVAEVAQEAEEAAPEIVEPPSLVEAEIEHEPEAEPADQEDDIELSRIGSHFVIKGTRVVVSIQDGSAIGFLDESNVLHKEESEEVKSACESYGLLFA